MSWSEQSPQIIGFSLILLWCVGFVLMVAGRRLRISAVSIIAIAMIALLSIGLSAALFFLLRDFGGAPRTWGRGWIGPRDLPGAITVGVLEDPLGLAIALLTSILVLAVIGSRWLFPGSELKGKTFNGVRVYSGSLLGASGLGMSWLSSTPWLSLLGLGLTTFAGVVALGVDESQESSNKISRFGREKTWGLVVALLGVAVLSGQRSAITLDHFYVFSGQGSGVFFDSMGGILLALGLYLHTQPFPFLGWLVDPAEESTPPSILLNQIIPSLAAFAVAVRFQPELSSLGVLPVLGTLGLLSAFFSVCSGLAQPSAKKALSVATAAAFSMAFTALCWGGPAAAVLILIGTSLGSLGLSYSGSLRELGFKKGAIQITILLSAFSAIGMIGFVGAGGYLRLIQALSTDPVRLGLTAFVLLSVFLLFMKTTWAFFAVEAMNGEAEPKALSKNVTAQVWAYLLILLSLGVFWTGSLSGGVIPHDPDQVFPSWISLTTTQVFGAATPDWADDTNMVLVQGFYWSIVFLALLISYWVAPSAKSSTDRWLILFGKSEKVGAFFRSGYRLNALGAKMERALNVVGAWIEEWVGARVSSRWIPKLLETLVRVPAISADRIDQYLYRRSGSLIRRGIEIPAKVLQLIQNGDVQWYLLFAMGSVFAVLIHFLRV